jgi:hypothetical protein
MKNLETRITGAEKWIAPTASNDADIQQLVDDITSGRKTLALEMTDGDLQMLQQIIALLDADIARHEAAPCA